MLRSPKPSLSTAGFTLAENLVIVVMIGIMAAFTIPSYLSWVNNKRVDDSVVRLEGALREAQSEAIKRSRACSVEVTATEVLSGEAPDPTKPDERQERCLITGDRVLPVENSPVVITGSNTVRFTYRGTTNAQASFLIYNTDGTAKMRCIVVSDILGIIRTGNYAGANPGQGTPPDPTQIANQCQASPLPD